MLNLSKCKSRLKSGDITVVINKKKISSAISSIQLKLDAFNSKYKCNVNANRFIDMVNKEIKAENYDAWDDSYRSIFSEAYIETMLNMISDKNNPIIDANKMLADFEIIMRELDIACKVSNIVTHANAFGRMDDMQRYDLLSNELQHLPYTYSGLAEYQYKSGKYRLSDMLSYAQDAIAGDIKNDFESQKRIIGYIRALEKVNSNRSAFGKLIYRFTSNAELRNARLMRQMLKNAIGENSFDDAENASLGMIDMLQRVKNDLQECKDTARIKYGIYKPNDDEDDLEYA